MSDSHQHFHQKTSKTPKHKNTFVKTCSLNNSEGKNLKWQLIEKILTEYLNIRRPGIRVVVISVQLLPPFDKSSTVWDSDSEEFWQKKNNPQS